jgi:D-3-phosphoglycerate dehydrogenase
MIINCARGGVIDEKALYEALERGLVAGAAIDVFTEEPARDNILFKSDRVVVTPHLAASTSEAETSAGLDIAEQITAVLRGLPPKSPVNIIPIPPEKMQVISPYLAVASKIGKIAIQLMTGQLKSISIIYEGNIASEKTEPLRASVLCGILETISEERVNIVNVDIVASRRGLVVIEEKKTTCDNYASMITVKIESTTDSSLVAGTSMRGKTYLTRANDYWLEIEPSTNYMLFTEHNDRPGMIGIVGSIVGAADINISQMQVSQGIQRGNKAMMVLCLEKALTADCYQKIVAVPDMYRVVSVRLI